MQSFKSRAKARRYAMQALYSWAISKDDIHTVEAFYLADRNPRNFEVQYFHKILHEVASDYTNIDANIGAHVDRPVADISSIELTILRVAAYEFMHSFEIPFRVIISEAIELAKTFGAVDSHKFVNRTLDNLARTLRPNEISGDPVLCGNNTTQESAIS